MRLLREREGVERRTVSLSPELDDIVNEQVEAGIAESRSEWFETAGWLLVQTQEIGLDALRAESMADQTIRSLPHVTIEVDP